MEVDSVKNASEANEIKVNGLDENASSSTTDKKPGAAEMTSADYYFDSYAHFGKEKSLDL